MNAWTGGAKRKRNLQKNDPVSRQKAYFRRQKLLREGGGSGNETGVPDLGVPLESVQPNREEGSQIKSVDFFQIAPFEDVLTHVSKMRDGSGRPKTVKKDIVADDGPTQPVPHSTLYSVSSRERSPSYSPRGQHHTLLENHAGDSLSSRFRNLTSEQNQSSQSSPQVHPALESQEQPFSGSPGFHVWTTDDSRRRGPSSRKSGGTDDHDLDLLVVLKRDEDATKVNPFRVPR